jgi:hypothetical protein
VSAIPPKIKIRNILLGMVQGKNSSKDCQNKQADLIHWSAPLIFHRGFRYEMLKGDAVNREL